MPASSRDQNVFSNTQVSLVCQLSSKMPSKKQGTNVFNNT